MYIDMRKFGIEAFSIEVIEKVYTVHRKKRREKYWMEKLNSFGPVGYNKNRVRLPR